MVDDGNFDEGKQLPVDSELPVYVQPRIELTTTDKSRERQL
jgi:hypothetical protein